MAVLGCCSAPAGYTLVRNGLRLSETHLDFPTETNVIRLAVRDGAWESKLWLRGTDVRKGCLTFIGSDGDLSFVPTNSLVVRKNGEKENVFPLRTQSVCFNLLSENFPDEQRAMLFQREVTSDVLEKWIKAEGTNIWRISPGLIAAQTNGFWLIEIPFVKSADFEGNTGRLTVIPNWYNGPKWMR